MGFNQYATVNHAQRLFAQEISPHSLTPSSSTNNMLLSKRYMVDPHLAQPGEWPPHADHLAQLVFDHNAQLYATMAVLALLIYEYLITFHLEVAYIWKSKPKVSLANGLFFVNRYAPLIRASLFFVFSLHPAVSVQGCDRGTDLNSYTTMISIATVEVLMLFRAWVLWDKYKPVGAILAAGWISAMVVCIVVVRSNLKPIPGVIPLPPMWFLPCDRPSPYKYFIEYCMALFVELLSLSFMMGRIAYLATKTKSNANSERANASNAVRVLRALKRHGAYYFACVIFVMMFTVFASFIKPLARVVINAGFAPTITSIACNRVIFALRGLYLEIGASGGYSTDTHTGMAPGRTARRSRHNRGGQTFGDGEIAETRHDMATRDVELKDDYLSDEYDEEDDVENSPPFVNRNLPAPIQLQSPSERNGRLAAPLRSHSINTSTFINSEDSTRGAISQQQQQESKSPEGMLRAITFSHNPQSPSASSSKFGFGFGPSSVSTHGAGSSKKANSPERRTPPPSIHFPPDMERYPNIPDTPTETPGEETPTKVMGVKFGSKWWRRKQGRNESYGEVNRIEPAGVDSQTRPRGKERHPLDHHYEMDTIHSQVVRDWSISDIEDEEEEEGNVIARH